MLLGALVVEASVMQSVLGRVCIELSNVVYILQSGLILVGS